MCGIAGFLDLGQRRTREELQAIVRRMAETLRHRGPNDEGVWLDEEAGIGLGHRRLAILDLSAAGHQPMVSACGRYVISFNGEIYNFRSLRKELEGLSPGGTPLFRGHSDTEVMLAAISQWGVQAAVQRFNGMFAFALWDRQTRSLHLVRDRLGEKPLYYGWRGKTLLFGSELKALAVHPDFQGVINRDALTLYLRHNYLPAPYSIYQGILKLPPGSMVTLHRVEPGVLPEPLPYWSARQVAEQGVAAPLRDSLDELVTRLDALLRDAVKLRMEADVPLGAFLSGGIDSSLVVALMQTQSDKPIKTFTIGFHEAAYNEANEAGAVARYLGTQHTELYVTPEEAQAVIPHLPMLYDEPFADASQIPTFLISELTHRHVTVSLSGDGGDELFAGYNRYFWGRHLWRWVRGMPKGGRIAFMKLLRLVSPHGWGSVFQHLERWKVKGAFPLHIGDKLHLLTEILGVEQPEMLYRTLVSHWKDPASLVFGAREPPTLLTTQNQWANLADFTERMSCLDTVTYLPDDILVKVDRASMGVGLEARVPYLDHRVVELAWRIPMTMKIRHGLGKWILRQVLYRYAPKALFERPKMGFGVPIDVWLRGPLRAWAEALLDERRLRQQGILDPGPIRQKWEEHLAGRYNWQYHLWDVLMFEAWLEQTSKPQEARP